MQPNRSLLMIVALPFMAAFIAWSFIAVGREHKLASEMREVLTRLAARHPALSVDGRPLASSEALSQALASASDGYGEHPTHGPQRLHVVLKSGPEVLAIDLARDTRDRHLYWVYPGNWHNETQAPLAFAEVRTAALDDIGANIR